MYMYVNDTATYFELRDNILQYERTSTWTAGSMHKTIGATAPMTRAARARKETGPPNALPAKGEKGGSDKKGGSKGWGKDSGKGGGKPSGKGGKGEKGKSGVKGGGKNPGPTVSVASVESLDIMDMNVVQKLIKFNKRPLMTPYLSRPGQVPVSFFCFYSCSEESISTNPCQCGRPGRPQSQDLLKRVS